MSSTNSVIDTDELARFRQQWKAEVHQRREIADQDAQLEAQSPIVSNSGQSQATPLDEEYPTPEQLSTSKRVPLSPLKESLSLPNVTGGDVRRSQDLRLSDVSDSSLKRLDKALVAYRAAVQAEQCGALDDAIQYYRQAFRLNSLVDKAYIREELHSTQQIAAISGKGNTVPRPQIIPDHSPRSFEPGVGIFECSMEESTLQMPNNTGSTTTGLLTSVISTFPVHLSFDPDDKTKDSFMSLLSEELVLLMLRYLDVTSVERFAVVDRKARALTLDHEIWSSFARSVYFYPQVSPDYSLEDAIQYYHNDYRRLYIEQPRIRLDGVYIAVCHYVRRGLAENVWVQPTHLVTYHRYLRFFPDGRVICLRANEDQNPQTIIPQLRSTPAMDLKEMSIGRWRLDGTTVLITDIKYVHKGTPRHTFQMCLALKSKPVVGRWNRLDFLTFDSVHPETGETESLSLKNERSFWFSKVRSYV